MKPAGGSGECPVKKIVIVDYGLGNLRSVRRGIEKSCGAPVISTDMDEIASADALVLPGVGAFRDGIEQLGDLRDLLVALSRTVPTLGICLGMQMLMEWSEENGIHKGLGLGWNQISLSREDDPLFRGIPQNAYMYFVHSFWADTPEQFRLTETDYITRFASSIRNGTAWGTQFHPEKSGDYGLKILKNFVEML